MKRSKIKTKKAYSLLELIVSLAIIAFATVVMINFLIVSVKITVRNLARSFVREEISNSVLLISRDIRNADDVISINCPAAGPDCELFLTISGQRYRWSRCPDAGSFRICKDVLNTVTGNYDNILSTSDSVNIDYMSIDYGYSQVNNIGGSNTEINILVTVAASHARPGLEITNIVRQSSASTRNYQF